MAIDFIQWCFNPQVWVIVGILLIMADIFLGYDFFVLPAGVAAFVIAALLYGQEEQWIDGLILLSDWHAILITYAVLSVVATLALRLLLKKRRQDSEADDINVY